MTLTHSSLSFLSSSAALQDAQQKLAKCGMPPLTEEQADIANQILLNPKNLQASLKGPAGTGKTTLLVTTIVALVLEGYSVRVAAFTHKACSVLAAKLRAVSNEVGINLPVPETLHKLLNLKPKAAKYGEKETFSQSRLPDLYSVDILIVDECSMIGEDLYNYVEAAVKANNIGILYAGDACQLRPVGEDLKSKTFNKPLKFKLTKVLRHDGAILNLATQLRTLPYIPQIEDAASDAGHVCTYEDLKSFIRAWSGFLGDDPDDTVMLCYTNANRRSFNDKARILLFGPEAPRFRAGDTVYALSPILRDDLVLFNNNEPIDIIREPRVLTIKPVPSLSFEYQAWELPTVNDNIYTLATTSDEKCFYRDLKALGKEIAAAQKKAGNDFKAVRDVKRRWASEYFPMKNFFADVDYGYAMTIHKSQGSTFKYTFVHPDYTKAYTDQKRLLYVAITRAARSVHLVSNRY